MAFKDILVALTSYPEPTPVAVVDDAVSVATVLGAHLAALSFETRVQVPGHFISNSLVAGMISAETEKSRNNARELLAAFDASAEKAGILHETILEKCITLEVPDLLVEYARLRDLTILSVPESFDQWFAEAIIFGSGKPTLILPENPRPRPFELGTVAVAWDFSRAAARAISDALPLLEAAKRFASSRSPGRRRWIPNVPPKKLPRTWPGTVSMWCWTRSMPRVVRSAPFSNPIPSLMRLMCWSWAPMGTPGCGSSCSEARPRACCRSRRYRSFSRIE